MGLLEWLRGGVSSKVDGGLGGRTATLVYLTGKPNNFQNRGPTPLSGKNHFGVRGKKGKYVAPEKRKASR